MNLIEIIADVLQAPDGAYDRMLGMGVPHDVIDAVLALLRDQSAELVDCDGFENLQKFTFIVKEQ